MLNGRSKCDCHYRSFFLGTCLILIISFKIYVFTNAEWSLVGMIQFVRYVAVGLFISVITIAKFYITVMSHMQYACVMKGASILPSQFASKWYFNKIMRSMFIIIAILCCTNNSIS